MASPLPGEIEKDAAPAFEAMPVGDALSALAATKDGLSDAEADKRLREYGPNALPAVAGRSSLARFIDQFRSVLIYVLIGSAIVTAIIDHWIDTSVIMAVVIANALMGWFQEGRAEQALEAVSSLLAADAVVFRSGIRQTIPATELVPGDLVLVQSGDRVPADLRLIEANTLSVDEALLTGESLPVDKITDPVARELALADQASMAFTGTTIATGRATGLVVATGSRSELGKIGRLVESVEHLDTPLLTRLSRTARRLTIVILAFAAVTFGVGLVIGVLSVEELFLAAVGLAVSAIPEGLPAIMTIILAFGVRRMAAKGALIRRLPAVETLGSVTVICTDKTGTLTRNELVAREIVSAAHRYRISGEGYAPEGEISEDGVPVGDLLEAAGLAEILLCGVLCNDARLTQANEGWTVAGDPIEGALEALGSKGGLQRAPEEQRAPRIGTLPFESDHRYMATLHRTSAGPRLFVKGAPEKVLDLCASERSNAGPRPINTAHWGEQIEAMATEGLRVLAFATGPFDKNDELARATFPADLEFLGLIGFIDPPRPETVKAVADCLAAVRD